MCIVCVYICTTLLALLLSIVGVISHVASCDVSLRSGSFICTSFICTLSLFRSPQRLCGAEKPVGGRVGEGGGGGVVWVCIHILNVYVHIQ
jgi:hypothetical protein